jgi:hypothetical protein
MTLATTVGPAKSWRLVYDIEKNVISYFESVGYTTSIYMIFEGATEQDCIDEAERLSLVLPHLDLPPPEISPEVV